MCMKFAKGAMQGPLGDIGRHGTRKLIFLKSFKGVNAGPKWDYLGDTGRHRDFKTINCKKSYKWAMQGPFGNTCRHRYFKELLGDIGGHRDYQD